MAPTRKKTSEKWQTQKSALTRDRIIIAALECIVELGYESTTMAKIAGMAKVSLGSVQYHFPAKIDAIKAAVNYLHVKRLADHQHDLENIPAGMDPMAWAIESRSGAEQFSKLFAADFAAYLKTQVKK